MRKRENINLHKLKIAIVTEELTQLGGAERVLDCFMEIFPKAPIYTLVWNNKKTGRKYEKKDIRTSFIQKLPFGVRRYKWYLPLMPKAVESFNLQRYDLIISSSSALIKGVKKNPQALHICYCHTPTRWLWSDQEQYLKTAPIPFFVRPFVPALVKRLQKWDLKASQNPDFYIANSKNIQAKIKKYYHREAFVIWPPVETSKFVVKKTAGKYYLIVSRIEPYKKVDLVVRAFNKLRLPLKVVGSGTRAQEISRITGKNIDLVGQISDKELINVYSEAIATIQPQEEDAGIVPLESMAAGRPVVAFAAGGALESVIDGETGVLFKPQTVEGLIAAIRRFRDINFNAQVVRRQAEKFDKKLFKQRIIEYIMSKINFKNTNLQI